MWKGTGRSGIGDQTIIGEYDDWDGLSMNGRQWKNRTTKETRDLSGADYWHQRKALEPKIPEDIPTFVNGKANVKGFREQVSIKPQKKKTPISSKILSQNVTLNRVDQQEKELNQAFENSEIDLEEYEDLLYCLQSKRDRAHKSLCKALGRSVEDEEVGQHRVDDESVCEWSETQQNYAFSSMSGSDSRVVVKNPKKDLIIFLTGSIVGLTILLTLTNT